MTGRITHPKGTVRKSARSLFAQGRAAAAWAAPCSQAGTAAGGGQRFSDAAWGKRGQTVRCFSAQEPPLLGNAFPADGGEKSAQSRRRMHRGGAPEQACRETEEGAARVLLPSKIPYPRGHGAVSARCIGLSAGHSRKTQRFSGNFQKRRKFLHLALTSGKGCGILSMWLAMTNRSADTKRRRTWERRPLRGTTGGAGRKRSFFPSRRARGCGRRPVWLTPVMIGISPLSFPSFPVFLMNGPGRTPYRLGPNAARFQLCVLGAGGGFFKSTCAAPGGFV